MARRFWRIVAPLALLATCPFDSPLASSVAKARAAWPRPGTRIRTLRWRPSLGAAVKEGVAHFVGVATPRSASEPPPARGVTGHRTGTLPTGGGDKEYDQDKFGFKGGDDGEARSGVADGLEGQTSAGSGGPEVDKVEAAEAAQAAALGGGGGDTVDVAVSGGAEGPCGPVAPAVPGGSHDSEAELCRVLYYERIRTVSGPSGYALRAARGRSERPPRWRERARVSATLARQRPQAALRAVLEHYSRWNGHAVEFIISTNSEDYGYEAMLKIDSYGDRFVGDPCSSQSGAENEVCYLALHAYHDQGYIVWT